MAGPLCTEENRVHLVTAQGSSSLRILLGMIAHPSKAGDDLKENLEVIISISVQHKYRHPLLYLYGIYFIEDLL